MKNKNGFTLVELLAVIVILAVIMIIAIQSVLNILQTAKEKSFKEYLTKAYTAAEKKYLSRQIMGTSNNCTMYNITTDLGMSSTGNYKGYVLVYKNDNSTHYLITLDDGEFAVYGIDSGEIDNVILKDYVAVTTEQLSAEYLAGVSSVCSTFTYASDGTNGTGISGATSSEGSTSTGTVATLSDKEKEELLGKYVLYYPTSTSYTLSKENTGASTNSTINPSELTLWRILFVNDDNTIDIVSEYTSSSYISFNNKIGYINYVDELQKTASSYKNEYALDARTVGYNGQSLNINDTSELEKYYSPWISKTIDNSNESKGGGDILYERDVNQIFNVIGESAPSVVNNSNYSSYYLASRYYSYNNSGSWNLGIWEMIPTSTLDIEIKNHVKSYVGHNIIYVSEWGSDFGKGSAAYFRPIVTLKSSVYLHGSGTSDDPYTLSV